MGPLDRGLYIVESEISILLTSMRRGNLWNSNTHQDTNTENLIKEFAALKKSLGSVETFGQLDTVEFLMPFLDVIRSEDVTGYVTGLALTAVNKFLAYDMIDADKPNVSSAVENLADAVTHARFVGSDPGSDEVVLMKIFDVLKILILSKVGLLLTNESVCDIMQSTLRICFEPRLSELLRRTAQNCLTEMVQLLFTRLPSFSETQRPLLKKLKMRSGNDKAKRKSKTRAKKSVSPSARVKKSASVSSLSSVTAVTSSEEAQSPTTPTSTPFSVGGEVLARSPIGSVADLSVVSDSENPTSDVEQSGGVDTVHGISQLEGSGVPCTTPITTTSFNTTTDCAPKPTDSVEIQITTPEGTVRPRQNEASTDVAQEDIQSTAEGNEVDGTLVGKTNVLSEPKLEDDQQFTNEAGVTFTSTVDTVDSNGSLIPYGLPTVYELLRFLASLINPNDPQNTEQQIQIGLSLITSALEVGVESMEKFPSLMILVKDDICRNLISLLSTERVGMFSASLRCCFLVFSTLRSSLKLQLEKFLNKLCDLIGSESTRISYEHKELSLEQIVLMYKMPGFITELYLNFDCGLYTTNLFEDLTKVLSKNAYPVAGLLSTNHLALDALLVVLESIERQCQRRISDRVPQPPQFKQKSGVDRSRSDSLSRVANSTSIMNKCSGHIFANSTVHVQKDDVDSSPCKMSVVPTHESLMAIKHKKKLLTNGTEQFNMKPSKGIEYLQENRLLSKPTDPMEVAHFLRENPHLDKNMIGEYISNKKNLDVLKSFVKSFEFTGMRIDEALRQFLQTFRLPGEAPLISMIMEIFGEHWHISNGECLADADAPYTLAYAVIMLNTDQHNPNASKQNVPMTHDQFVKNLRGTNGGGDHEPEMLSEIYQAIREDEIVMPAEQKGLVKENYLWKQLLRRGEDEVEFIQTDNGIFDHNLFGLTWGPAVAALSYIFDKSNEPDILRRSLDGFSKCSMVAAHYAMSDVLDNLVITLTKFTTLLSSSDTPENFKIAYGANSKALLATRAVFSLTHKYGDILREGWRNLAQCLLHMFKCQLLPTSLMESEDYIEASGRVSLYREDIPREKADSGLINSLVSFIVASSEVPRALSKEEEEHVELAKKTVAECHPEHLLAESKFLLTESLQELMKFLIGGSSLDSGDEKADHQATLFYLELISRITIANKDRVMIIWRGVSDHISRLISATAPTLDTLFELERAVTALLRLSVRLARKEEIASTVVQSLKILLAMKPGSIFHVSKQISYGIHELLRNNAANIHSADDWAVIFSLLEVVGAGASPDVPNQGLATDEDSGQGGESEGGYKEAAVSGGWIDLGKDERSTTEAKFVDGGERKYSIVHTRQIVMHDSISFLKSCESLSFLVRDVVHITPDNFHACVAAIRTFVEASYKGEMTAPHGHGRSDGGTTSSSRGRSAFVTPRSSVKRTPKNRQPPATAQPLRRIQSEPRSTMDYDADEEDEEDELVVEYTHVTMQLLDLMYTLHSRAAGVHEAWAAESGGNNWQEEDLWDVAWCPVLQGMARLCCDRRAEVRTQALTLLQRSLLIPELQALLPNQWEYCFLRVLFPMLRKLLEPTTSTTNASVGRSATSATAGREETKLRAAMMLSKVFLQHLSPLSSLPTFTALWLTILDFLAQFVSTASTDLLVDALPESLKNMLLVMDTSGRQLFFSEQTGLPTPLWTVTWEKIDTFLPNLRRETFGDLQTRAVPQPPLAAHEVAAVDEINTTVEGLTSTMSVAGDVLPPQPSSNEETAPSSVPLADIDKSVTGQSIETPSVVTAAEVKSTSTSTSQQQDENTGGVAAYFTAFSNPQLLNSCHSGGGLIESASLTASTKDKFPSLPLNLQGTTIYAPLQTSLGGAGANSGDITTATGVGGPLSPIEPPLLPSSAFSLPCSPTHYVARGGSGIHNALFTPIALAPGQTPPLPPIAAPTPTMLPPPANAPIITAPVVASQLTAIGPPGLCNTAFVPAAVAAMSVGNTSSRSNGHSSDVAPIAPAAGEGNVGGEVCTLTSTTTTTLPP